MRFSPLLCLTSLLSIVQYASAVRLIESNSLNTCQDNSSFTAQLFDVLLTPDNKTLTFDVNGVSSISGNVTFSIVVTAYGYTAVQESLDPCDSSLDLSGMCPMSTGPIDILSSITLSDDVVNEIPSIAYTVPDLDATVKVLITSKDTGDQLACVEAMLSNGKTVYQKGVGWGTAVTAGLALGASAVTSGLGHSNTAAHVAANALSLFGYFQGQAIYGFSSVNMPPIVEAWTQNFAWTMGIIRVGFMQDIATWYLRSTGGTPATILNTLTTVSVQVLKKRSYKRTVEMLDAAYSRMVKRDTTETTGTYVVRGISRVAFRAGMETTNFFMTGLMFFCVFVVFTIICVALFKGFCEFAVKAKWMKGDKFLEFRNGYLTVLKGIMYRLVLIGFVQMTILSLWEFTQLDSAAIVVLAIFFFFGMLATLCWASWKVIRIAQRSVQMHKNPAYILYSDPSALNKWGFLYVQFRATAYYYIVPTLAYILVKGMFIGLGQGSPIAQTIGLLIVEAAWLIGASVIRPWMDKSTNSFNISIAAVNFVNAVFLLIFTNVFNQPGLVTGVIGVVLFILNAVFALVLLILVLIATVYAVIRKNPDTRYQPMQDDRASFIKSQTNLTTELDALGATARGEMKGAYKPGLDLDDDDSWSSDSRRAPESQHLNMTGGGGTSVNNNNGLSAQRPYGEQPHSPIDPSVPLFPSNNKPGAPPSYTDARPYSDRSLTGSPAPTQYSNPASYRMQNNNSPAAYRSANNASPWQRGAGYDH